MSKSTEKYRQEIADYESSSGIKKMVTKEPVLAEVGDMFAIRYSFLSTPIKKVITFSDVERHEEIAEPFFDADIGNMVTVVECIDDGLFLDLVSGFIFRVQEKETEILDTVTEEYQSKARKQKDMIMEYPLAIKSSAGKHNNEVFCPYLEELTPSSKESIINRTIPNREVIIAALEEARKVSKSVIEEYYEAKNDTAIRCNERKKREKEAEIEFNKRFVKRR